MNFFRPKLLMSFMLMALIGFAAESVMAQDIGVGAINVRANSQTGNHPILLDTDGNNSIDVLVTNYDLGARGSSTFTVDLEISWPNQVGGPLVLTKNVTPAGPINTGESFVITWTGEELHTNNFDFDRRVIFTLDARVYNIMNSTDANAGNDRLSDWMPARMVAPAFNVPQIKVDADALNNPDFTTFSYLGDYLTASGLVGDLEVVIASGTYATSATMSIEGTNFDTDNDYVITFSGRKNYPSMVEVFAPARTRVAPTFDPWMWNVREFSTKFQYITLSVDHTGGMNQGGQALFLENSSTMTTAYHHEINGCVFNGAMEEATSDFAAVYCDGNYLTSFKFNNNVVNGGYSALVLGNDVDPTPEGIPIEVMNNKFFGFSGNGVYVVRPAVTLPANYEGGMFTGNLFQTTAFEGTALYVMNLSVIRNNTFNMTGQFANAVAIEVTHDPAYETPAIIEDNNITHGPSVTNYGFLITSQNMGGIYVNTTKKARIVNNNILIKSAVDQQGIKINGGGLDLVENYALIDHNTVDITTEGNAIRIENGAFVKAYYNELKAASASSANGRYILSSDASTGIIANNMCSSTYTEGFVSTNDVNMNFYYNTIDIVTGVTNTDVAFQINDGNTTVKRNMLVNHGTNVASYAVQVTGTAILDIDENNYWSAGPNFGDYLGAVSTIAAWRGATGDDANSTNAPVIYDEDGRLIYEFFDDDDDSTTVGVYGGYTAGVYSGIYYADPLFAMDDPLHAEFEMYNFYGEERNGYYAGNINLIPMVDITTEPLDITSCYGEDHMLQVVADVSHNAKPWYQWYKDGEPIEDETNALLNLYNLDWDMAGAYKCLVSGQGGTEPMFSKEVMVITIGKTEVSRQPMNQTGALGKTIMFEVEAHIHGFQDDPDNELNQPLIQWFSWDGSVATALEDSEDHGYNVIAGSKSSILTISNLSEEAWTSGTQYYARLLGFCDYDEDSNPEYVMTEYVSITAPPSIDITQQPQNQDVCVNGAINLEVEYDMSDAVESVEIQWKKDGANIVGATEATLTIDPAQIADAGVYSVDFTVYPGDVMYNSESATITINDVPTILTQPVDVEVNEGDPFDLMVEAEGYGTIEYQWYKDGAELTGETSATFTAGASVEEDAGSYYCMVSNPCGDVQSESATVTVDNGGSPNSVEEAVAGGFTLEANIPNPFSGSTQFTYETAEAARVNIVLTDMYGRVVAVLADKLVEAGPHTVTVDSGALNLTSGVYNYTLTAGSYSITKQMILVK